MFYLKIFKPPKASYAPFIVHITRPKKIATTKYMPNSFIKYTIPAIKQIPSIIDIKAKMIRKAIFKYFIIYNLKGVKLD